MWEADNVIHQNEPFWVPNASKNYKCIESKGQVICRELSGKLPCWQAALVPRCRPQTAGTLAGEGQPHNGGEGHKYTDPVLDGDASECN